MYNRYIRNDQGVYTRIPEEDPRQPQGGPPPPGGGPPPPPPPHPSPPPSGDGQDSLTGLLRRLLDQLNLSSLDSGDLLLLALLFFLFREGADDELLAALGLLLIL